MRWFLVSPTNLITLVLFWIPLSSLGLPLNELPYLYWQPETGLDTRPQVLSGLSNTYFPMDLNRHNDIAIIDNETSTVVAKGAWQINKLAAYVSVGATRVSGGYLDKFVQNYHKALSLPNGAREFWPDFKSRTQIGNSRALAFDITGKRTFARDPELGLLYPWNPNGNVGLMARTPVGRNTLGTGTPGLALVASHRWHQDSLSFGVGLTAGRQGKFRRNNIDTTQAYAATGQIEVGILLGDDHHLSWNGTLATPRFLPKSGFSSRWTNPPSAMTFQYQWNDQVRVWLTEEFLTFTAPDFVVGVGVYFPLSNQKTGASTGPETSSRQYIGSRT